MYAKNVWLDADAHYKEKINEFGQRALGEQGLFISLYGGHGASSSLFHDLTSFQRVGSALRDKPL